MCTLWVANSRPWLTDTKKQLNALIRVNPPMEINWELRLAESACRDVAHNKCLTFTRMTNTTITRGALLLVSELQLASCHRHSCVVENRGTIGPRCGDYIWIRHANRLRLETQKNGDAAFCEQCAETHSAGATTRRRRLEVSTRKRIRSNVAGLRRTIERTWICAVGDDRNGLHSVGT